jgi:hypothetical protein
VTAVMLFAPTLMPSMIRLVPLQKMACSSTSNQVRTFQRVQRWPGCCRALAAPADALACTGPGQPAARAAAVERTAPAMQA